MKLREWWIDEDGQAWTYSQSGDVRVAGCTPIETALIETSMIATKVAELETKLDECERIRDDLHNQVQQRQDDCRSYSEDIFDLGGERNAWREQAAKQSAIISVLAEALEFVSMPITGANHTVESLLETIANDDAKAKDALEKLKIWKDGK